MINHIVLMKFKPGVSEDAIKDLEAGLDELPNRIYEIQMYELGRDVVRSRQSYDFGLVALFANLDTLQRYHNHPDLKIIVQKMNTLCENIVTVDFEGTDSGSLREQSPETGLPPLS